MIKSTPRTRTISHPSSPERNCSLPLCYLENADNGIFCRSKGNPQCWKPPSCFHSSSSCLMYIPNYGLGDVCATNRVMMNTTDGSTRYTCQYTYHPPTPIPTTYINDNDAYKLANEYDKHNNVIKSFKPATTTITQTSPTIIPTLAPTSNCSIPLCYYAQPGIFARKIGVPECWKPPTCFHSSSACLMYLPYGIGDQCVTNRAVINTTDGSIHYKCQYTYHPPTPRPTPPPLPPGLDMNVFEVAETYDNNNNNQKKTLKRNSDLINYLYEYYSQYERVFRNSRIEEK